jgi:hypothetical protein
MTELVAVSARLSDSTTHLRQTAFNVTRAVAGGYYISGNGDFRVDMTGVNIRGMQGYHTFHETAAAQWPGQSWRRDLVAQGVWYNLVLELKSFLSGNGQIPSQSFTVEGRSYTIPASNGRIQMRPGTTAPCAYSYDQVLSGTLDGLWHRTVANMRALPWGHRINIQLASEVDTDNEFGTSAGTSKYDKLQSDTKAVAAYSYIISWMREPPGEIAPINPRITFSMGWAGQWSGLDAFKRCHPDFLPVDYCHWNVYNHSSNWVAYDRLRETLLYYRQCGPVMRQKPIIISEWGCNSAYNQSVYIRSWPAAVARVNAEQLLRDEGQYVMTLYFGSRDSSWGTLSPKPEGISALQSAYRTPPYTTSA